MSAITQDDDELAALAKSERVAEAALPDDENAFRLGGGALLPVLDDERRLSMARRDRVAAQGRRLADIAQLYVATAADWRDVKELRGVFRQRTPQSRRSTGSGQAPG